MPPLGPAVLPSTDEAAGDAVQRVVKVRRDYNEWVARETMEDYALRFTPRSFRKWSELRVANTAFGAASFLVLEAVGATLLVEYGFVNAFWAILATGLIIFLAGLPISVYAARYGLDMDLLTRGAGFGYIGSTITSLIYATFTFIFFALEAAIMAYALELAFDIPPAWGYLICALVVIPLVTHGVTAISRLQVWTQPLWLVLLVVPYVYVFRNNPDVLKGLVNYGGDGGQGSQFNVYLFGAAMTVGIALITQMGEQADYLRFMPERTAANRKRWWLGVFVGGPGWVVLGVLKMLGGALLAYLAISHMVPADRAVDPNQMYLAAYEYVFPYTGWAIAATALFVVVSQLKINVTNAYAGSLAWSNFFARLTHSHPGRVVWVVFNTLIALMLMELDVFRAIGGVLGLYANVAISWIMAVVADLVINKPLGLSPKGIEFKRAHLFDVNPVGVGAMGAASVLSVAAHLGFFGPLAQAFSALIALVTAFVTAPLIAWATRGRYYIARAPQPRGLFTGLRQCVVCEREYEVDDLAHCPAYLGQICSLCCSLDARCNDLCKPDARLSAQWTRLLHAVLPRRTWPFLETGLGHYLLLMAVVVPVLAGLFGLLYQQELRALGEQAASLAPSLRIGFVKAFAALLLVSGIVAWWLVLTHKSRQVAQEESNRQTQAAHEQTLALRREIDSHRRTDEQLQQAKRQAELANQAKSRYITTVSHELRTPLNSILGYAQLLEQDAAIPANRKQAVSVIRRGGDHLLSLIEGTLDIARIEGGKLRLESKPMRFRDGVQQIVRLFELQAADKGIAFSHDIADTLPEVVRCDEKRLRQILINVLGNAVKFTHTGRVTFRVRYVREMAVFEVEDTGPGIPADQLEHIFEPFARGTETTGSGTGLGLTISKMLTDLMGGEMSVSSTVGEGTLFRIRLFLPGARGVAVAQEVTRAARVGYRGPRRRILVVDNEEVDRALLASVLEPLGFELLQAASGHQCLEIVSAFRPDAVLMDLAMPGIDGWATIRAMRAQRLTDAPVAIVSGNAFDKELDNDVGVRPEDFVLKPVRVNELLDWLGARLGLDWIESATEQPAPAVMPHWVLPSLAQLQGLQELVALGYLRGIQRKLDEIEGENAAHGSFVAHLRGLARNFQLDALTAILTKSIHDRQAS
ncbi:hybrid sensor histidine kinase/response regulator [Piscinibacter gummiphilus]|uniref:Virulence sensor protein BvgS n=2 Tax=Piscinibacter gummiphilus TaxID=946333 RepID=A0A1W6LIG5_9BURK|nr:ATP-binding protein [Piscinibacter gummiphilus]ARN24016.1 hybrid sensor histidine kinase/response regulator [Piscinibacter gummiphilus]GLS97601.1 hybrid sensor histidine kinase/response regulator [Piscinibacter gummiphilus]